jgi:hypothetical protein
LADEKSNADERIPPEHWPAFVTRLNGFLGNPRWILLIVSGTNADNAVVLIEYEDTFELRGIAIVPAGKKLPQDTPRKATYLEWRDGVYVYHSR